MADEELRREFSRRLTYYLSLNGYNQADMARRMGVSTATAAKWCTGQSIPRIDKIQSLCNWLGIEKSQLLDAPAGMNSTSTISNSPLRTNKENYYINREARELAEFLHKNPEYKVLFDASRKVKKEDIEFVKQLIDRMSSRDGEND
ncbi:MAG: helix-turn-helix domain-containing protein [Lachnospiraceae bacterium]|nr:helix-turn-helix domain-containing protein [Lachnospiraceae bacterium]